MTLLYFLNFQYNSHNPHVAFSFLEINIYCISSASLLHRCWVSSVPFQLFGVVCFEALHLASGFPFPTRVTLSSAEAHMPGKCNIHLVLKIPAGLAQLSPRATLTSSAVAGPLVPPWVL